MVAGAGFGRIRLTGRRARYPRWPPLILTSRDTVEGDLPNRQAIERNDSSRARPSRSPHAQIATDATSTTQQAQSGVSTPLPPAESSPLRVTVPGGCLSTVATHLPHTHPTTHPAQKQTTVPSCTSIETSLVQGVALTARNHPGYGRCRNHLLAAYIRSALLSLSKWRVVNKRARSR
jgi:hypothetical protein